MECRTCYIEQHRKELRHEWVKRIHPTKDQTCTVWNKERAEWEEVPNYYAYCTTCEQWAWNATNPTLCDVKLNAV